MKTLQKIKAALLLAFGKLKAFAKKLKFLLQLWDVFWSLPLMFVAFWLVGLVLTAIFGYATGTYDLGFIQPLFLAICVVNGASAAALGFMFFYCRGLFRYFYGHKNKDGSYFNYSGLDWKKLQPLHRFILFFFVLFAQIAAIIFVYLKFV